MGLFRRKKRELEMLPVEGHDDLAMVDPEDLTEIANDLAMEVYGYVQDEEFDDDVDRALMMGFFHVTKREAAREETLRAAAGAARVGYVSRATEWGRLETARKPKGWSIAAIQAAVESDVAQTLREAEANEEDGDFYDALSQITAYFVRNEPLDPPHDAEGMNPMWSVPGPGGAFRAVLRDKTLFMVIQPDDGGIKSPEGPIDDANLDDFRMTWKFGFLLRSFEEFFRRTMNRSLFPRGTKARPSRHGRAGGSAMRPRCAVALEPRGRPFGSRSF